MTTPRETSRRALESAPVEKHRNRVLRYIRSRGGYGATIDEVEAALKMLHQTAGPAVLKLRREGLVISTGKTRKTSKRRDAVVWAVWCSKCRASVSHTNCDPPGSGEPKPATRLELFQDLARCRASLNILANAVRDALTNPDLRRPSEMVARLKRGMMEAGTDG